MATPAAATRIDALDITKGILVVFMVVYHSLNYSTDYRIPFRYLSFLPPSFIMISGFLLSHVYLARRGTVDAALCRRLVSRGAKLVILFVLLNVGGQIVRSRSYHGPSGGLDALLASWQDILFWGGMPITAFDILLPIAYLLLLAPLLLWLHTLHRLILPSIASALLAACTLFEKTLQYPPNLGFVSVGIFGVCIGAIPHFAVARTRLLAPVALLIYPAVFYVGKTFGQPYLHLVLAATVALTALVGISVRYESDGWIRRRLIALGRHSLVAYILQIAVLQLFSHINGRPAPISAELLLMFAFTLVVMAAAVEVIDFSISRSKVLRVAYSTILP